MLKFPFSDSLVHSKLENHTFPTKHATTRLLILSRSRLPNTRGNIENLYPVGVFSLVRANQENIHVVICHYTQKSFATLCGLADESY